MTREEYLDLIAPLLTRLGVEAKDLAWLRLDSKGIEYALFERDEQGNRILDPQHAGGVKRLFTVDVS